MKAGRKYNFNLSCENKCLIFRWSVKGTMNIKISFNPYDMNALSNTHALCEWTFITKKV